MTPTDVLAMVAADEIPDADIERSKDLRLIGFEDSLNTGFLGFTDGTVLKVDPVKYDYMVALAGIMNPGKVLLNRGGEFGPESGTMKIFKLIHKQNKE